jgi:hypothetical protein
VDLLSGGTAPEKGRGSTCSARGDTCVDVCTHSTHDAKSDTHTYTHTHTRSQWPAALHRCKHVSE